MQDACLPLWTERERKRRGLRDPLALGRTHERALDRLLPGITTQTWRARYYSFYLWAIQDVHRTERPRTRAAFARAICRREAAFAMACVAHHDGVTPKHLVGAAQARRSWRAAEPLGPLSIDFAPLPCNDLGGHGQFYAGSLHRMGLTFTPDPSTGVDDLTPAGRAIAESLNAELGATRYAWSDRAGARSLPRSVLVELGARVCLCRSRSGSAGDREALRELFLPGLGCREPGAARRRDSLLLCMDVIRQAWLAGAAVERAHAGRAIVDQALYGGWLAVGGRERAYTPPAALGECAALWRELAFHRYCSYALEWILLAVTSGPGAEVVLQIDWAAVATRLGGRMTGRGAAGLARRLGGAGQCAARYRAAGARAEGGACEERLVDELRTASGPADTVARAVELLVALHARHRHEPVGRAMRDEMESAAAEGLWFGEVMHRLERSLAEGGGGRGFAEDIIARELLPRLRCGRLFRDAGPAPVTPRWRDARISACLSLLEDLDLIRSEGRTVRLSGDGDAALGRPALTRRSVAP